MKKLSLIVPIASFIWLEIVTALLSGIAGTFQFIFVCLFVTGIAFILRYAIKNRWVLFAVVELLTIFYLIEHFTNGAYSVFMNPASIILGASGVAKSYMDIVGSILAQGIGAILLMHVPAIAIIFLNIKYPKWYKKTRFSKEKENPVDSVITAIIKLSPGILAILVAASFLKIADTDAYTFAYSYDNSVRKFGVMPSVFLDAEYGIFGVPQLEEMSAIKTEEPDVIDEDSEDTTQEIEVKPEPVIKEPTYKEMGYKGLFKGKNLIIICGESFTKELIREDLYPTIYKMAKEGIQIDDFYQPAWGGSTSTGEASILLGLIPTDGVKTIQKFAKKDNSFTVANRLKAEGYNTFALHNGNYDYYNRNITHPALGYDQWIACGTGMQVDTDNWPKSDQEMMDYSVDLYKDSEPFCVYYMTISGHCQYNFKGNSMSLKHKNVVDAMLPNSSERIKAYYACNYDLELGLESLLRQLKSSGKLDDTVIVMTGDHYPYALEKGPTYDNDVNYLEELYGFDTKTVDKRDHNALIIWSPCLTKLDEPVVANGTCYTPDILPTLLNLFGLDYNPEEYVGRDILSDTEGIAIWTNGSWKTDKGFYNASNGKFYGEADKEYIKLHKQVAADKIQQSRNIIKKK